MLPIGTGKRLTEDFTNSPTKPMSALRLDSSSNLKHESIKMNKEETPIIKPSEQPSMMTIESEKPKTNNVMTTSAKSNWFAKPQSQTPQQAKPSPIVSKSPAEKLWTDRYAPNNIGEIIGNQDLVRNLMTWLKDWYLGPVNLNNSIGKMSLFAGKRKQQSLILAKEKVNK